jgi:transcriptional regulator CtsR
MEYQLSIDDLDDIIDEILDEDMMESVDEKMLQTVLFEELDEDSTHKLSEDVKTFLDKFDQHASDAIERKMVERLVKKQEGQS